MKKKGFTLVELLAVIIILAVIALIATPIVLKVVDSAKKSAFESSVYGVIDAIELEVAEKILKGESLEYEYNFPTEELEVNGVQPSGGIAKTNAKGKITLAVHNGDWCVVKGYDDATVTVTEYTESCVDFIESEEDDDDQEEPVAYLYNDMQLPALPDWDKETYPYVVIAKTLASVGSNSYTYTLKFFTQPYTISSSSPNALYTFYNTEVGDAFLSATCSDDSPLEWSELTEMEHVETWVDANDVTIVKSGIPLWSNYDLMSGTTVVIAASEPVPVYE